MPVGRLASCSDDTAVRFFFEVSVKGDDSVKFGVVPTGVHR